MQRATTVLTLSLLTLACGCTREESASQDEAAADQKTASPPREADEAQPQSNEELGTPSTPLDERADGDDGDTDEPAPAATEGTPAGDASSEDASRLEGPCKINWSNGPVLRFSYDSPSEGSVRIDEDRDGKSDLCARFVLDGPRLKKMEVDEGCNGSVSYAMEPEYRDGANLATASYATGTGKKRARQELTLVLLPSFVGLEPGYALFAKRTAIDFKVHDKLVRRARVTHPSEGQPLEATFEYDDRDRIESIREDIELDGTVDRLLRYTYDDDGRISRMEVTLGSGENTQKSTARMDYSCLDEK